MSSSVVGWVNRYSVIIHRSTLVSTTTSPIPRNHIDTNAPVIGRLPTQHRRDAIGDEQTAVTIASQEIVERTVEGRTTRRQRQNN